MRKRSFYLPDEMYFTLEAVADQRGVGASEVLRGIIQEFSESQGDDIKSAVKKKLKDAEKANR